MVSYLQQCGGIKPKCYTSRFLWMEAKTNLAHAFLKSFFLAAGGTVLKRNISVGCSNLNEVLAILLSYNNIFLTG